MKLKKRFGIAVLAISLIFACSMVALALFYSTTEIKTNIKVFNISSPDFTVSSTGTLEFVSAGQAHDIALSVSNQNTAPLEFFFGIEVTSPFNGIEDAIFVYYNNSFIGTLSSVCRSGGISVEKTFSGRHLIAASESNVTNSLRFELHNNVNISQYNNKSLSIKYNLHSQTINVKNYVFVNNEEQLRQAVYEVNLPQGQNKTVVFSQNITLTKDHTITAPCTIDLLGRQLNFADHKIYFKHNGVAVVKSTRTISYTPASGFVLDSAQGVLDILESAKAYSAGTVVLNADLQAASDLILNRVKEKIGYGLEQNSTTDLLCGLGFYLPGVPVTGDSLYTLNNGVITTAVSDKTQVASITVGQKSFEFKIFGETDAVFNKIINTELSYLNNTDIAYNLFLPTAFKEYDAYITWWSSNPQLLSVQGVSPESADGTVKLVATVTVKGKVYTKDYVFNIVKMNNEMRFRYLLSRLGTVRLDTLNARVALPDPGSLLQELGVKSFAYSLDPKYYFITKEGNSIFLNQPTFETYAQVNVTVTFLNENSGDLVHTGTVGVEIQAGDATELRALVYDYIRTEAAKINIWQNILSTRAANGPNSENGNFSLPSQYMGYTITYAVLNTNQVATIQNGNNVIIDLTKLSPTDDDIRISATVAGSAQSEIITLNIPAPAALHNDANGFMSAAVFNSTRNQVYAAIGYSSVQVKNYIFVNDIANVTSLNYSGISGFDQATTGITAFTSLTSITLTSCPNSQAFLANLSKLNNVASVTITNSGLTDVSALFKMNAITYLDVSANAGVSEISKITYANLSYLNVHQTGINYTYMECYLYGAFKKYKSATATEPNYFYTANSVKTRYTPRNAYYEIAMDYLNYLKEVEVMTSKYMQMPTKIILPGGTSTLNLTWAVVSRSGTLTTNFSVVSSSSAPIRLQNSDNKSGRAIISASINYNGTVYIRYFIVDVKTY